MYEVEVKVPADLEPFATVSRPSRRRLAVPSSRSTPITTRPHREFAETDEALRIRSERPEDAPDETRVTYRGPLVDDESKTRKEVETSVADRETMDAILSNLGFEPAATVRRAESASRSRATPSPSIRSTASASTLRSRPTSTEDRTRGGSRRRIRRARATGSRSRRPAQNLVSRTVARVRRDWQLTAT